MRRLAVTAALLSLAACASNDPPPERDFTQPNTPMMDNLKGRAQHLLEDADEVFAKRKYAEANAVYKLAAAAAEQESDVSLEVEANAQVARCYSLQKAGKQLGRPYLERARKKASQDHPLGWTRYLGVRGIYERERGETIKASETFKEMHAFAVENELHERAIDAAHHVAIAAPPADQEEWAKKGIAAAEAAGATGWLAALWNNLGATYEELKRYPDCVAAYTKAREYHRKIGNPRSVLIADWALGHGYRLNGQLDEAEELLSAFLKAAEALPDKKDAAEWSGYCKQDLGEIAVARGEKQQGLAILESARVKWVEAGLDEHWPEGFKKLEDRIKELR